MHTHNNSKQITYIEDIEIFENTEIDKYSIDYLSLLKNRLGLKFRLKTQNYLKNYDSFNKAGVCNKIAIYSRYIVWDLEF